VCTLIGNGRLANQIARLAAIVEKIDFILHYMNYNIEALTNYFYSFCQPEDSEESLIVSATIFIVFDFL